MLDGLWAALQAQLQNQIVAGGLALGLAGILVAALRHLPAFLWSQVKRFFVATAVIDSRNDIFNAYVNWLNELPFGKKSRLFTVVQAPADALDAVGDLPRLVFSPAPGLHIFWHDGHVMWIEREIAMNLQVVETMRISMLFARRARLEAMLADVIQRAHERLAGRTQLYVPDQWGTGWRLADAKPRRRLDSLVLAPGLREQLVADIRQFFDRRAWYAQMGIPWRRGYLFYGPPGTGKTSLAFALAGELELALCTLSLTNPKLSDASLSELLQRSPARSLILIEDVDAFFREREKSDERVEVSFSGVLNALDGVAAQEGRIVVLTTNHKERLDPALIRPGRIDVALEIGLSGPEEVAALFRRFHPQEEALVERVRSAWQGRAIAPSAVQQVLLAHSAAEEAARVLIMRAAQTATTEPR
ncbi:MAG: AAA family ATPase [Casimicrobiaceae bacterium]|nr:AAA family ATPase [Casimicrobiaceae bacterium]MDW8313198.1 AAA family ATPase [Burkholderiales bacterium]